MGVKMNRRNGCCGWGCTLCRRRFLFSGFRQGGLSRFCLGGQKRSIASSVRGYKLRGNACQRTELVRRSGRDVCFREIRTDSVKNFPVAQRLPESFEYATVASGADPGKACSELSELPFACGSVTNASSCDGSCEGAFCACAWRFYGVYVFFRKAYASKILWLAIGRPVINL